MKSPGTSRPDPTAFIQANLPISPVPSIPEILLHTAGPASGLWRLAGRGETDPSARVGPADRVFPCDHTNGPVLWVECGRRSRGSHGW